MSLSNMASRDYDRYLTLSEKIARADAIAANEAFSRAMMKAIKRGREIVKKGTFVDPTPLVAKIIRGEVELSACGSPAAMCADFSPHGGSAGTLK